MKYTYGFLFILLSFSVSAQEFKPVKVNVSVGFAETLEKGFNAGFLVAVEPKYGLSDHIDLGVRIENASVARGVTFSNNNQTYKGKVSAFTSGMLTANYLIGTGGIRPFVGLGVGVFSLGESGEFTVTNGQTPEKVTLTSSTHLGGMIRAGIKAGHFVAGVEYNAIPTTAVQLSNTTIDSKNAYLAIKVGVDLGGGRK